MPEEDANAHSPGQAETILTERFRDALGFAAKLHSEQRKKGTNIPYVSHLLAVASLVLEDGGDEDEAIAALLHDAIEDQGPEYQSDYRMEPRQGVPALKRDMELHYGSRVLEIVEACTDTDEFPKPPWTERKEAYLKHLEKASKSALRVSCADKLHNARSILTDYQEVGDQLWSRFNKGWDQQRWYYDELVKIFNRRYPSPLSRNLESTVAELKEAVTPNRQMKLPLDERRESMTDTNHEKSPNEPTKDSSGPGRPASNSPRRDTELERLADRAVAAFVKNLNENMDKPPDRD